MKQYRHIAYFLLTLLLLGGAANKAWATDVTYHILTLPIDNRIYHMKDEISGKRLEAFKVTIKGQSQLELPAQYKSPLATGFTYYAASDVTKSGSAVKLFDATDNKNKGYTYVVRGEDTPEDTSDDAAPVAEGTTLPAGTAEYYVVYTYNSSNEIAKLDGSVKYNINTIGYDKSTVKEKGFMAYNRGRNNRPAILPKGKVDPEMLASEDFMKVDVTGTSVSPYWSSGDNKNKQAITGSKFYFMFELVGEDPYNIIIRTAYDKDTTYIEKNDNSSEFVYKYYKEGSLFANGTANAYIASDEHRHYNYAYDSSLPDNPTDLTGGTGTGWDARNGYYHGQKSTMWNSFALLNNSKSTGYVFMGTRTVDGNGDTPDAPYFLKEANTCNNLVINQVAVDNATNNLTIEGLYPIKKLTFKIATPFYKVSPSAAHIVSVEDQVSQYTVKNDVIVTKYLPDGLKRKYIEFNGKFYKDAAYTQEITRFSDANWDEDEGYQVYVGYDVADEAPEFLSPSASYTTATWYELTDEGSTQEYGRKIKNNDGTYKNNGANGEYVKESEFALVGDPYELKVLYREGSNYVTLSGHDTWEMPNDDTNGSFLLREYKGTGHWYWDAGHASANVTYGADPTPSVGKDAQTIVFNLSGLNGSKYYKITVGGTDASQIVAVSPRAGYVYPESGTSTTVEVFLKENESVADKTMTVTIQEYNDNEGETPSSGESSVITITQGTTSSDFTPSTVTYSTNNSTRVKVLDLPKFTYTYNIVDKSGRIAVKATAKQTIFSTLSLASIPSIIVSPFLLGETVTFYDTTYTDGDGRATLVGHEVTETPPVAHDIYVTYTTAGLVTKPIMLNQDQEFNVVLNGQYLWYDSSDGSIKTNSTPSTDDLKRSKYLWKLRNRDPYAMLIDNLGAREHLSVTGDESVTMYNDVGTPGTETRQKGAWVALESIDNEGVLSFTKRRSSESEGEGLYAQRFVAKASTNTGVYEVMVATGAGTDASTTYYNIGRPTENTVKIYDNAHYAHGSDILKFQLEQTIGYVYHLIDKAKHELLTQTSQNPDLAMPADYQSPLVSKYHFYDPANITETSKATGNEYEPKPSATELTSLASLNATFETPVSSDKATWSAAGEGRKLEATSYDNMTEKAKQLGATGLYYYNVNNEAYYSVNVTKPFYNHIYVTYDANDIVKFGNTSQYTLKFLEPFADGYYLEDGNDKLTTTKLQAVYPYTNGDGNLNIYGQAMKDEQMGGGASTRPRWVWYFNSTNDDPYHVRIHSRSTISYNGVSHPTYLQTYAVHFNQDTEKPKQERIVTGGALPGIASATPTEYMILGAQGAYKLMTTYPVEADLDGDGNTTGSGENERRKVTSFEQYWKTYNMAKLQVLGIAASTDAYSTDESTWVVPKVDDPETTPADESTYRATLEARGWHSYNAYANATRWNGYNDKEDGHEKKVVENIEHWFQTFDMRNGTFDIESADIPPVLVLLDLHGWEIMRLPLPTTNYPYGDTELAALRAYDSPMVDKYYFYSNATKASGCHKYRMRLNDDDEERDQIKVDGERYSSTSLGDLPPITATGVKSGSTFNDQYVIYTVKEEYAKSYSYDYSAGTETPSEFLMVQHGRFYKMENKGTIPSSYMTKPIAEHTSSGTGNLYDMILDPVNKSGNDEIVDGSGNWKGNCLWYVKPNQNIDKEMGIKYASVEGNTGEPWTEAETKKYYHDNGKDGFDPYNLQIQLKNKNNGTADGRYLSSHMTSTRLENGVLIGNYSGTGGTMDMTLVAGYNYTGWNPLTPTTSTGYDHTNLTISNQTFMAVSDANGNMQLMPRFDHTKRVDLDGASPWNTTLEDPVDHPKASAEDNASMGAQTTFFVRPQRLIYEIIDNEGRESLRYKRGGDYFPTITAHFRSPLAKNFTYYKELAEPGAATSSSVKEWTAATGEFKRTATTEDLMNSQKYLLPTAGTYYYRIGKTSFEYKKVTVAEGKGLLDKQITGSFAEAGINSNDYEVKVRYEYDADVDRQGDKILEGKWFTIKLDNKDVVASGTIVTTDEPATPSVDEKGTGVSLLQASTSKPSPVDADDKTWQWKFLVAPIDPTSELHESPDPYDVQIFNRSANYTDNPTTEPSPMAVGIKVNSKDRFALLSHTSGGYALAVAGLGTYTYNFLNGADMSTSVAAITATETNFTQKAGIFDGVKSQLVLNNDVTHNFVYNVVNNANKFAVSATQDEGAAEAHSFQPYLPEAAQTPLLRMKDYKYYGSATVSNDTYTVVPNTKLFTLHGLYDDAVYVRYEAYHVDSTEYKIPNKKTIVDSHVARDPSSVDVSMNINGELPYNIIWYNDNMMSTATEESTTISDGGSKNLSGDKQYVWYIEGNDPYALKIKHKLTGNYVDGTGTLKDLAGAKEFMLLKKSGYDYGVFAQTGDKDKMLSFEDTDSNPSTAPVVSLKATPNKFIIFGLSVHDLIYRLIIAKTCELSKKSTATSDQYVDIPYSNENPTPYDPDYNPTTGMLRVYGTTQRDLTSQVSGVTGDKYQLGETISVSDGSTTTPYVYCVDAGAVSIGDLLQVPNEFNRPNCTYEFYIDGVWDRYDPSTKTISTANGTLNGKYKGIKLNEVSPRLMSDADLIDKVVRVNIVYSFDKSLATNSGLDFVRSTDQNLWYTMETQEAAVPQLARYTKTQGLTAIAGRETHYTNDYLFTPVGDVYGFKMYNRYTVKNGNESNDNDQSMVMTSTALTNNTSVNIAAPGSSTPEPESQTYTVGNEIYELITGDVDGSFRVHPVANNSGSMVYLKKVGDVLKLSTTPQDWKFGLDMAMLQPYYLGAGNVGGLNAPGKAAYKAEIDKGEGEDGYKITNLQNIVYNDDYIVHFTPGYYRLHSQPGVTGVSPVRYASGYLHEIEKTAGVESTAIPLHFYSKQGVSTTFAGEGGLGSGFTETAATRGDIPVPATENDPSTIFYVTGTNLTNNTLSNVAMGTQGLNVIGNKMGTGTATTYRLIDIGGGVVLLVNTGSGNYLTFDQNETNKYDLHYKSSFRIDDVKWCMEPANTLGLKVTTNNGGDGYYYSTLYVPYDVLLPADAGGKTYNAYICKKWYNKGVNPVPVPEKTIAETTYGEGKFVPAGTPVIIRTNDDSEEMKLTLPSNGPTTPVPAKLGCVFSGEYLEQMLDLDASHDVYTLGLPFTSNVHKDDDYNTTGDVVAPLLEKASSGVGFYINATSNKEADPLQSLWTRNNRYVLHNKIYYREPASSSSPAPQRRGPEFVPVIFDDEEGQQEMNPNGTMEFVGDGCIYDLMGRKVATREQVEDGSWKQRVATGIYILNGKKFQKK